MTCIAAVTHEGTVYMAGERGNSDEHCILSSIDKKIVSKGQYLIGYSGNTGMGQAVQYGFTPPVYSSKDINKFMISKFVPTLRKFYEEAKINMPDKDDDHVSFIVGLDGCIFELDTSDFQVGQYEDLAIGSGSQYALGSLFSTRHLKDPRKRLRMAIEASIQYSPSCQGPIDYLSDDE
jgi:ATP-dependent protease HslVU (ClpYQ) peptidase subunit